MYGPTEPGDRLTAFGNQLVEIHLWLREELTRLREEFDAHLDGGGGRVSCASDIPRHASCGRTA